MRTRRRILAMVMVLLILAAVTMPVKAEETEESVTQGWNLDCTFDESSGTLTIAPNGETELHYNYNPQAQMDVKTIVIQEGVTAIGEYAFRGYGNLEKVVLPESLTRIEGWAFSRCRSLSGITLPGNLMLLEYAAFVDCTSLPEVEIPDSVAKIRSGLFSGCSNLKSVRIPDSVTTIEYDAFSGCTSLTEVQIPASVTKIEGGVFQNCSSLAAVYFKGSAPIFSSERGEYKVPQEPFLGVTADVYYNGEDPSWTDDVKRDYGGSLNWMRHLYIMGIDGKPEVTSKVYVIGSGADVVIECSGALEDFVNVEIDGQVLDTSYYKAESGSTVLTILSAFLEKLSEGDHTVTLNYTYGSVSAVLTVVKEESPTQAGKPADSTNSADQTGTRKSPQTGEK